MMTGISSAASVRPSKARAGRPASDAKRNRSSPPTGGMTPEEFEHYGAFITCLEGFFKGYETLLQLMRPYQFGRPLDR